MDAVLKSETMSISLDEVRHVARLARLDLDEVEILSLQGELNALLGHFADIQGIDVSGIDPSSTAIAVQNAWAEDAVGQVLTRREALGNAPMSKAGLYVVPTIIED
jgi:aspartyl-tRNA(Asn)/glutamyl-tRNA(Gln) amidotransferase subunit C